MRLRADTTLVPQTLIPAEQRDGLTASSTVVPVIDTLAAVRRLSHSLLVALVSLCATQVLQNVV